jgi:hypothetical protein
VRSLNQQLTAAATYTPSVSQLVEIRLGISRTKAGKTPIDFGAPGMLTGYGVTGIPEDPAFSGGLNTQSISGCREFSAALGEIAAGVSGGVLQSAEQDEFRGAECEPVEQQFRHDYRGLRAQDYAVCAALCVLNVDFLSRDREGAVSAPVRSLTVAALYAIVM